MKFNAALAFREKKDKFPSFEIFHAVLKKKLLNKGGVNASSEREIN